MPVRKNKKPITHRIWVVEERSGDVYVYESEEELFQALENGDIELSAIDTVRVCDVVQTASIEKSYRLV